MRRVVPLAVLLFALFAGRAFAATAPSYAIEFDGTATEHQVDQKQNIQDNGTCDSAEHVDVTATMTWSTNWGSVRTSTKGTLSSPTRTDGSRVTGNHVKDACGLPIDQAPEGWPSQATCDASLVTGSGPTLTVENRPQVLLLTVTAPTFSVPVSSACPLNVRNDQLTAHVVISQRRLRALKRGASLLFTVGTHTPGPGDAYDPSIDCSQPTKPYEGYRTADHCQDNFSWSGTVRVTRAG